MEVSTTQFEGLFTTSHFRAVDERGIFVKPWIYSELENIFGNCQEIYFSSSKKGVLRGLHFQRGASAQAKYVICLSGAIEDIAVDIRPTSPTLGKVFRLRIEALSGNGVIIPPGFAHGIFAHEDSIIVNVCNMVYSPGDEGGVNWRSVPELSDLAVTTVSSKDRSLPSLSEMIK